MRLAVTELRLSHFRSHRALRLSLSGRPVVLFGPNGAGKTNVLEAVSLLSPGRGLRGAAAEEIARRPEALGWKVAAMVESLERTHEVETWAGPGEARQVRIDGKAAAQAALGRIARMVWLTPAMDRIWIEGSDGRRRFLDRIAMSFEPGHAEAVLDYEKAMRERNRLLRDQVSDARWFGALESRMAAAGAALRGNRAAAVARLVRAQEGAGTAFPAASLTVVGPEGAAEDPGEDLAAALAASRAADLRAGRTLVGPHRADLVAVYAAKGMPAAQCSTGEQKALLLSLVLANARALAQDLGAPPILLLDEVAAHLDAARRAALYQEICTLGAQAWMTGTGPELFEGLGDRAEAFELRETGGASEVIAR
ncbi:MAG: DNA replication/repair protein RecF [Rhodobacteraceae bacterium]|nr:DNA replication/repair protein RecF [Paracoccaceae bacterium]